MSRTAAWVPAYKVDSRPRGELERRFRNRIYRPNQPTANGSQRGLSAVLIDYTDEAQLEDRERQLISVAVVSKRKRPSRARELQLIDEFMAAHG